MQVKLQTLCGCEKIIDIAEEFRVLRIRLDKSFKIYKLHEEIPPLKTRGFKNTGIKDETGIPVYREIEE